LQRKSSAEKSSQVTGILLEDPIYTAPAYLNFGGAALIDPQGCLSGLDPVYADGAAGSELFPATCLFDRSP